ncbi:MAG: adenylyltransferase/cytidyltransferase family protein [Chloroflexota bacterium]|nr:adenylyltransferase/cytidyltransferase family protein [Chloroflexota bacterium]
MSRKELAKRSRELRAEGKTLVLTNGCFDLLHVGHIRYLAAAREMGDALAVGVNSDDSVRQLKGPSRPITSSEDRVEILAALEMVDFVTVFDEDTAAKLAGDIAPAMYVKGGDYSSDPRDPRFPIEGHTVCAQGGTVRIIPYVADHSTSAILRLVEKVTGAE